MKTKKKIDHGPAQSFSLEQLLKEHLRPAVLAALLALLEEEVRALCGPPQHPDPDAFFRRAGSVMARVNLPGCPQNLKRPRVRRLCDGGSVEVALSTWQAAKDPAEWQEAMMRAVLCGVSTRGVSKLMKSGAGGMSRSAVSRRWQRHAAELVEQMQQSDLSEVDLVAIMLDAVILAGGVVVTVALGIDTTGRKRILGFRVGSSESREVCQDLLSSLKARGLEALAHRDLLAVIDGSDALRSALLAHWPTALVQRCLVHKERNLRHYLGKRHRGELARLFDRLRKAQAASRPKSGRRPSARSWRTGTLRLGPASTRRATICCGCSTWKCQGTLHRTLLSTNCIENVFRNLRRHLGRVCRWRENTDQADRWMASGLTLAERGFRRISGHEDIAELEAALRRPVPKAA